jgi:hypothetical protein
MLCLLDCLFLWPMMSVNITKFCVYFPIKVENIVNLTARVTLLWWNWISEFLLPIQLLAISWGDEVIFWLQSRIVDRQKINYPELSTRIYFNYPSKIPCHFKCRQGIWSFTLFINLVSQAAYKIILVDNCSIFFVLES